MGCFDEFVGSVECPHCKQLMDFYEQTKNYDCVMQDFKVGDYIDKGNVNYFYDFEYPCPYCKESVTVYAAIRRGQLIGYYTDISKLDIHRMKNIEENYQRNIEFKMMCETGYGLDKYLYENDKYFNIGDMIHILDRDWIVESVFEERVKKDIENERLLNFYNCMFKKNKCYLVHDNNNERRMIIIRENSPTYVTGLIGYTGHDTDNFIAYYGQIGTEIVEL